MHWKEYKERSETEDLKKIMTISEDDKEGEDITDTNAKMKLVGTEFSEERKKGLDVTYLRNDQEKQSW